MADWWRRAGHGEPDAPQPVRPPAVAAQTRRFLKRGSRGTEVLALQGHLARHGFYHGRQDGAFGPVTEAAVIAFQRAAGLVGPNMGQVGNATWAELVRLT